MSRWILPFRRRISGELEFLSVIRKHPILVACLSSGILYRGYMAFPHNNNSCNIVLKNLPSLWDKKTTPKHFFSDPCDPQPPATDLRIHKLLHLHDAVEAELPNFFDKGILTIPESLMDPNTIIYFERKNGVVHQFRNRSSINASIIGARAYFKIRSFGRRLELTSILSDTEKWELEVCFRIVLLPYPSLSESREPPDRLVQQLERRARWLDFRATFCLNKDGQISHIKLTQFMPPYKHTTTLQNLQRLNLLRDLSPGSRRLPSPTPFLVWDLNSEQSVQPPPKPQILPPSVQTLTSIQSADLSRLLPNPGSLDSVYDSMNSLTTLVPQLMPNSALSNLTIDSLAGQLWPPNTIQLPMHHLIQPQIRSKPRSPAHGPSGSTLTTPVAGETISSTRLENSIFPYFKSTLLDGSFLPELGYKLSSTKLFPHHPKIIPT